MTIQNKPRALKQLKRFNFEDLFIDHLGWDLPPRGISPLTHTVTNSDGESATVTFTPIVHKREFYLFTCTCDDGTISSSNLRSKAETWLSKRYREHLIVFVDGRQTEQVWQWVRREPGQPLRRRDHRFTVGQSGESLLQKLEVLEVSFEEEEDTTLVDIVGRARTAFNVEKATKAFFKVFQKERDKFENFVQGISDAGMQDWYVSVMLNRLMFVYFIQKKGFLDSDPDYLRNRMRQVQKERGDDQFHSFYRYFLLRLFHDGLGQPEQERAPELEQLLGKIPYLNGGIFQIHEVEQTYPEIQIPDEAFERILDFFDQYQWHLDDRPLRDDNEINPDVLGYIFEKYINQKEMGAYYTKEDITEYISQNTIIPYLFDVAREKCRIAFEGEPSVWQLLADDPDRYIYEAVRHGCEQELPEEIAVGTDEVAQRGEWNTPTPESHGLPTEIWRETVVRRQRYKEVKGKLEAGEVREINDLITYNLDIKQFAQDVIETCEGPELLRAFWQAIERVTVLDPTCGSGAFLFAALNILQPLYEGCLDRMALFVRELPEGAHAQKFSDFKTVLTRIEQHPNRTYFVLKSIMINNLYGVDIMAEATEICKLRLFLKLAAQVEKQERKPNMGIEPLPDIDFNIRAGNTLVGFATYDEMKRAVTRKFDFDNTLGKIEEQAESVSRLAEKFRKQQQDLGGQVTIEDKQALQSKLKELEEILNRYLATEYGVNADKVDAYKKWKKSHQPFHWFTEFYGIVNQKDGFDAIVGNPPYLNLRSLKEYELHNYKTLKTRNLYPLVLERCQFLIQKGGYQGYIVPVSSIATQGYATLQQVLNKRRMHFSSYDDRPSHLFSGLDKNTLSILLLGNKVNTPNLFSTRLVRWSSAERPALFNNLEYQDTPSTELQGCFPKIGSDIELSVWNKLFSKKEKLSRYYTKSSSHIAYYSRKVNSFLQVLDFVPEVRDGQGNLRPPSEFKELRFKTHEEAQAVFGCLNSSLFRWFMDVVSDGSHLNKREVDNFPLNPKALARDHRELINDTTKISQQLSETSEYRTMRYKHDTLTVQCIIPKNAKDSIDVIDDALAQYYQFTDDELDFIINYDIKYRMGDELFEDEEDDE